MYIFCSTACNHSYGSTFFKKKKKILYWPVEIQELVGWSKSVSLLQLVPVPDVYFYPACLFVRYFVAVPLMSRYIGCWKGKHAYLNFFFSSKVLEICIAIWIHKSIIVFSLSIKLIQSAIRPMWLIIYILVFSVMSPLGIAIGIGVSEAQLQMGALVQAVLEGLAAGTFVYITFLEILPHELNSPGRQLLKVLFILIGFSLMAFLCFMD